MWNLGQYLALVSFPVAVKMKLKAGGLLGTETDGRVESAPGKQRGAHWLSVFSFPLFHSKHIQGGPSVLS